MDRKIVALLGIVLLSCISSLRGDSKKNIGLEASSNPSMTTAVGWFDTQDNTQPKAVTAKEGSQFAWEGPYKKGEKVPEKAVKAGKAPDGGEIDYTSTGYICRTVYNGGIHPGKIINRVCYFTWGGKEHAADGHDVLIHACSGKKGEENTTWKDKWYTSDFVGGNEANGKPLYVCRFLYIEHLPTIVKPNGEEIKQKKEGWIIGKVVEDNRCNYGWQGKELKSDKFQTLEDKVGPNCKIILNDLLR